MTPALDATPWGTDRGVDRTATTAVDGRRLAYATYGDPEGAPVVFCHGTPGSRRLGSLFGTVAHDRGVCLLAPDRPGSGRSVPWPDRSLADAPRVVGAVLDDAGVDAAGLVAFSGGAPAALAAAATSDRVGRTDLVAGAPPPGLDCPTPTLGRLLGALAAHTPLLLCGLLRGQAWLADRLDPDLVVSQYTADPDAVPAAVAETVRDDFVAALAHSRRGTVAELGRTAADPPGWLDRVDAEVQIHHGSDDANVPVAAARRLDARLPTADCSVREGADHLGTLLRAVPGALGAHGSADEQLG